MTRAAPHPQRTPQRTSKRPRPIPLEDPQAGRWWSRCARTLLSVVRHPVRSFRVCPEPIAHGRVMRLLATVRLPAWLLLVVLLAVRHVTAMEGTGVPVRAIHVMVDPSLARVLSLWILLMVPVGLPLLYFNEGLVAHVWVALTGGASRSIGASMRACGYVLAPVLAVVGLVDIPLYLGYMPGIVYFGVLGALALVHWVLLGMALAKTHQMGMLRGWLVALQPTLVFVIVTLLRALPELTEIPGLPPVGGGYAIP
ncbi:hypothetical protein [Paraliomyxa miuraensis]|uniref:hypothetical protein n=1 Tax=Paraliomyxa miuraensis TaxID=376150 RepID=UPI002253869F|nr:hypothetical protein [Paraliomyxa miuraensis]MCX4239376.1 hypothetical protein [Paraliomyxa miuraensis]